jgi:hypothetical protein
MKSKVLETKAGPGLSADTQCFSARSDPLSPNDAPLMAAGKAQRSGNLAG